MGNEYHRLFIFFLQPYHLILQKKYKKTVVFV